jgi:hypothetical protein
MIAFDSPEGATLRALDPSPRAIAALWFTALNEGQDGWAAWAAVELAGLPLGPEAAALRFLQAVSDGEARRMRQCWAILASYPIDGTQSRIIQSARKLRATLPI